MIKKNQLHKLIKSLSKSEKRYISLQLSKSKENSNYLKLFNKIDTQKEYDETKIKAEFGESKTSNQIHVTKNYLTQIILQNLSNFYQNSQIEFELLNNLTKIQVAFDKDLLDLAESIIVKNCSLARQYELWNILINTLQWHRLLLIRREGETASKDQINQILQEITETIKKLANLNQYQELSTNFFSYFQTSSHLSQTTYSSLSKNPLLNDPDAALSIAARVIQLNLQFSYQIYQNRNYQEAYRAQQSLMELLEKKPALLHFHLESYLQAIHNLINLLLHLQSYEQIPNLINKIRQLRQIIQIPSGHLVYHKHLLGSYLQEIQLLKAENQLTQVAKQIEEAMQQADEFPTIKNQYLPELILQKAVILFQTNQLIPSLDCLDRLQKAFENESEDKLNILIAGQILRLMIHFDLENYELLHYHCDQVKSIIKKHRRLKDYEKDLLKFFSLSRYDIRDDLLITFNQQLQNFQDNENFQTLNENIDFKKWLLKKITH